MTNPLVPLSIAALVPVLALAATLLLARFEAKVLGSSAEPGDEAPHA